MRLAPNVAAALLVLSGIASILIGIILLLQGFNVIPGALMNTQIMLASLGAIALIAGSVNLFAANRMTSKRGT